METERNKEWRKKQAFRMYRKRLKVFASSHREFILDDDRHVFRPTVDELAKCRWGLIYKSTGKPCSCWMCRGESFDRRQAKREAKALIESEML